MNTKLVLSLDSKVVDSAKRLSKKRGKTISKLIEEYLVRMAKLEQKKKPSILELKGIGGKIKSDYNFEEEPHKYLMEKYK